MRYFLGKAIISAVLVVGTLAVSAMSASADIICNNEGVCWHTHNPYDYPPEAHVTMHDNSWHWGPNEHYTFREWPRLLERRHLDRMVNKSGVSTGSTVSDSTQRDAAS